MANLGFHTALRSFLEEPGVHCERAFLERGAGGAARSFETGTPLAGFDVVAFSVSFEEDYFGIASLLAGSGIPLRASDRGDGDPIIVMGGVCAFLNPEPVADFMDAILVGGAETLVPPFVASLRASRGAPQVVPGAARAARLRALAAIPGVYVPSLYEVERGDDGRIAGFRARDGAPFPVLAASDPASERMAESLIVSDGSYFGNMFLLETSRGCARGCRFCATGHLHGAPSFRPSDDITAAVRGALACATRVGLVSATLGDHPEIRRILAAMQGLGVEVNVGSLRVESVDDELASLLVGCGVRTATIAPEAATMPLRRIIGKPISDGAILEAATTLAAAGFARLKLYFMVGLPGETEEDVRAIPDLAVSVREVFVKGRKGARVSVGVSVFVPKPRTPFQWFPMADERTIKDRMTALRRGIAGKRGLSFTGTGPREARREGVLARGGRELSGAIVLAAVESVPWKAALKRSGIAAESVVDRPYREDEVFPWDVIKLGAPTERLLASYRTARSLVEARAGRAADTSSSG
jgi:radical SAM superfamily enzyme YgiQ (UPF0313 family)